MYNNSMKITKTDYERLHGLIAMAMLVNNVKPFFTIDGISKEAYVWAIFNKTIDTAMKENKDDYAFMRGLYNYLDDKHIETALKAIILKGYQLTA